MRVGAIYGCSDDCTGRIVAQGTADDPILFTSREATPGPGDWRGVMLGGAALAGTTLSHAIFEYAGAAEWGDFGGAVHIEDGETYEFGRIAIDDCEMRNNRGVGLHVDFAANLFDVGPLFFASRTGNRFDDDGVVSVYVDANAVAELGQGGNTFAAPVGVYGGAYGLQKDATWSDLGVPYRVLEYISIEGSDGAVLTITDGAILQFVIGAGLSFGGTFTTGARRPAIRSTSSRPACSRG